MNGRSWQAVNRILADCLGIAIDEREAYAAERCAGDERLHREVRSLLRASTAAAGYFESLAERAGDIAFEHGGGLLLDRAIGHFTVTGALGAGGMGEVYRARDNRLHRDVALKILGKGSHGDPHLLARFDREATVLAALNHPNIASIYGREEIDGRPVLVLELIDGTTLGERVAGGRLSLDETLRVAREIATGLQSAHEKGIVHRDLKPSNVMLTSRGTVKILDFGIAKPLELGVSETGAPDLTATGVLLGTVPYMSPEQVRGQRLDQRADVWAFGCLLYEMLCGQRAFERETVADTLAAIIEHEPRFDRLPADTPKALENLLRATIHKTLDERVDTAGEVLDELDAIIAARQSGQFSVTVGASGSLEQARDLVARHAWQEAFDRLDPMFSSLDASDLALLGEAAWWVGRLDRSLEADQKAFSLYVAAANNTRAAAMAIRMADHNTRKLQGALVRGWLRRAERLLDGEALSTVHGWLLRSLIQEANDGGDHQAALELAVRMYADARTLNDADLQAVALHYQGFAMLHLGRTVEGMNLIDEAAVAAISGELSPIATAIIYCNAISACRDTADYQRAVEWTTAAKRWCERSAIAGFPGICRVARAEIMRLHGNWADAEAEALKACDELETFAPSVVRVAFHELGEVRLRLGEYDAAREAFENARQLGRDPQPGAALLKLAEGDVDGAASSIKRALEGRAEDRLGRARLLPVQVEIALERGDFDTARVACAELASISAAFDAPCVHAAKEHAHGALCLAEGDVTGATRHLREAIRLWDENNVPYECARARELRAKAYQADGDDACFQLELQGAVEAFVRLGAVPDSRRAAERLADRFG